MNSREIVGSIKLNNFSFLLSNNQLLLMNKNDLILAGNRYSK